MCDIKRKLYVRLFNCIKHFGYIPIKKKKIDESKPELNCTIGLQEGCNDQGENGGSGENVPVRSVTKKVAKIERSAGP